VAQGHRDPGVGRCGDGRRDAGDDLEGDAGVEQGLSLLAATGEDEGIAALQAHDGAAGPAVLDQQAVDLVLRGRRAAGLLGHADALGVGRGLVEQCRDRQPVVDDHVGPGQHLGPPHGEQSRVPGPGPDQVDGHG